MYVACISSITNDLGESLFWDPNAERLYWVDAWKSQILSYDPIASQVDVFDLAEALSGLPIGSIARHADGGMISGIRGGFYRLNPEAGTAQLLAPVERDRPATNRLNDGKCDRAGRFWCASVNTDHKTPSGALWRYEAGHEPALMIEGLVVGNGIAWSPDDKRMYIADTFAGQVWKYDFDLASGLLENRQLFISTAHIRGGIDGATVDADGCYWAALFRGAAVAQFDPDGKLMRHVVLPVQNPTICAFGGKNLDTLYVASASRFLDETQRRAQPLAGCVFAIRGLGIQGLPEPGFHA